MATTDLGKWMITNGGDYDPDATYEKLTMVMYNNSTYITLKTVTGVTPSNDQINYALMARGFDPGVLSSVTAVDTSGALGNAGETVSAQSLVDYLADAVMTKLVEKANISNVQVNDSSKVPSAALAYAMQQQITENEEAITGLNSELINGSGLGLAEGMYSIYAPNTADDMVYPGLYRLNGITVGSMTDFYGYAIVMSDLDHAVIKQLIYHNASSQSLLRYRFNNQWTDAGEFALKDDLADRARGYIDIENQEKFIGFVVNEYDPSILINPVSEYIRLQYKDIDTTYKIYDYGLWGNWENGKDIVSDLNIIKKKISFYAYGPETLNSPFKAGLTGDANSGIVISHFISDYYGCQLAISEGAYPSIFIRGYAEKWIEWKKVYPL